MSGWGVGGGRGGWGGGRGGKGGGGGVFGWCWMDVVPARGEYEGRHHDEKNWKEARECKLECHW